MEGRKDKIEKGYSERKKVAAIDHKKHWQKERVCERKEEKEWECKRK